MQPQHVETGCAATRANEALASQNRRLKAQAYQSHPVLRILAAGNTVVFPTSEPGRAGHVAVRRSINNNRRPRCPRASNCWQHSALLPLYRPAQAAKPKKNTLWLTQSRSRLNQPTQANTNKPVAGQAIAPVLFPATLGQEGV